MLDSREFLRSKEEVRFSAKYGKACVVWLLVAMGWGSVLRWSGVVPVEGLNYRFALHTHSHLALLGWVVMGFYVLLGERFFGEGRRAAARVLFWFLQACLLGMLVSFPLQGYGAFSIAASTLFVFGTYSFSWWLYVDCRGEGRVARQVARAAAAFLALSSLGPFVVGYLKATGQEASPLYSNALYFYLHFLYNGFFVCGLLGLVFGGDARRWVDRLPWWEMPLFLLATVLSYFLSVLWMGPDPVVYAIGAAGAALQLLVFGRWFWLLRRRQEGSLANWEGVVLGLLLAKFAMQLASAEPEVARWLFISQSGTIIGYIHFVMLGIMTPYVFLRLNPRALETATARLGAWFYGVGFVVTESLLFGAGLWGGLRTALPFAGCLFAGYVLLFAGSLLVVGRVGRGKLESKGGL